MRGAGVSLPTGAWKDRWDPGVREPAGCEGCPGDGWDPGCGARGVPGPPPCRVSGRRQELSLSPPPLTGAPMAGELRCRCVQTVSEVIFPKRIAHVELIPEGPHCGVPEVIATTKQGKKICLEPTAPWVKLIVTKILSRKT
ncbi:growth-regulated alpha protein-like [Dermochelys coriacea]|uniref:growth-regulated alpha protein-like n=1 Tax=Dermochelys coriacea TaxID=27794 RepID=UPI001CA7DB88|nr:growth-regulated alpha protein-like [Dermochelys coriacea]